jgi:hypothetical protein
MRFRLAVLAACLFAPAPAGSGELSKFQIDESATWRPSACAKPAPPAVGAIDTPAERNRAIAGFNAYAKAVGDYLQCAVDEANRDAAAFRKVVSDSLESEQQALKAETEELKALIEAGGRR